MHPDERYSPMSPEVEYEDKFAPVEAAQQRLRDMGAMQPAIGRAEMHYTLKRHRQKYDEENLPLAAVQQRLQGRGAVPLASGGRGDIECRHFNSPAGCLYGESCRFRHVPKGFQAKLPVCPATLTAAC
ncbi:hypothetical protein Taro_032191 [Colocasia esculenta]|uniref:C3H1-type domain-containing protein n=1 Tax=Colocasia esculenta TaxID=4460 RepID=A0A843W5E0_COLES|nr:hypothetical protein [Colocasia esculenta]